jgi:hypothetical protein
MVFIAIFSLGEQVAFQDVIIQKQYEISQYQNFLIVNDYDLSNMQQESGSFVLDLAANVV